MKLLSDIFNITQLILVWGTLAAALFVLVKSIILLSKKTN